MKKLKGKCEFMVVPVAYYEGQPDYKYMLDAKDEKVVQTQYFNLPWFYLSDITEKQAELFVEGYGFVYKGYNGEFSPYPYSAAKDSLISLLQANDCFIKDWKTNPIKISYYYKHRFNSQEEAIKDYEDTPDDLLLIKLN